MCSSSDCNRVSALLSISLSSSLLLSDSIRLTPTDTKRSFYKRGLLELFPPSSPTLINLHSITLNGCLVRIGSRSQPYNHLRQPLSKPAHMHGFWLYQPYNYLIQFSNLKFESERVAPLLSIEHVLDVLAGWHIAGLERCSCIILLCCEKFMSSCS
jgi:hypothetical protein